jgi:hypothetical protein
MRTFLRLLSLLLAWVGLLHPSRVLAQDAGGAFSCDGTFYQVRQSGTGTTAVSVLYRVDRSTSTYTTNPITGGTYGTTGSLTVNGTGIVVNGLAYNSQDGYLYALTYPADNAATTVQAHLYKIGQGGVQDLGVTSSALPNTGQYATGSFDKTGHYYVTTRNSTTTIGQGKLYRFDLNSATPLTPSVIQMLSNTGGTITAAAASYFDIAYDPISNKLFGVFADNVIYQLDLYDANNKITTGNTSSAAPTVTAPTTARVNQIGTTAGTQAIGTSFFDVSGRMFAYANGTTATPGSGSFYYVNLSTGAFTKLSSIDPVSNSDGASCINPNQRIDVSKELTNVVAVNSTTYNATYSIRVRNTGTVTDNFVQVSDFLSGTGATTANTTFPTATSTTIISAPTVTNLDGSTLTANASFTGKNGAASLLDGTKGLTAGQRAIITYTVQVVFPAGGVPTISQDNTAYATSTGTGPNNGYTQIAADGSLVTPNDLQADDESTNSSEFPNLRVDLNDAGDSASPTPLVLAPSISGTVFEDVDYGGGAGRSQLTSNGIGRSGVRVELYNGTGLGATYNTFATTAADGSYSFSGLTAGNSYSVRVLSNMVTSSRNTGNATGLVGVQTYRTSVTVAAGTIPDVNRVGGEYPARVEAANGAALGTFNTLLSATTAAQSISTVTLSTNPVPALNVDFGYNFDTVVNTNSTGQGSLRQFITNANALDNTNLDQVQASTGGNDPAPTVETSIFMIPDGLAHAGLTAYNATTNPGLATQLPNGVAVITPATTLPAIGGTYGANTSIDGTTQTQNVGNTNTVTLGVGGTVGTTGTPLAQLNGPEVQLTGTDAISFGFDIASTGTQTLIQGLAIYGFGSAPDNDAGANIRSAASFVTINQNVLGTTATSFTTPPTTNNADNIRLILSPAGTTNTGTKISNNLIGYSNSKGITINPSVTSVTISGNEVRNNGLTDSNFDGVDVAGSGATVTNNLFTGNTGPGVDSFRSIGSNTITGNTVTDNGRGPANSAPLFTPGVRIYGSNNLVRQNVISGNYGAGIMLEGLTSNNTTPAASATVISQNSIFNNGTVTSRNSSVATGQIGIDLERNGDSETAGTSPFVTKNSTVTTGANSLVNYPILTTATVVGTNLIVKGYAKAGATIELFVAQANPSSVNSTGANFGQGKTYLTTLTEGATSGFADTNGSTGQSYSGNINGFDQGSDTNANGFTFTIPVSSLPATLAPGTLLTSTATLNGATSEFSGNVATNTLIANNVTNVALPTNSPATVLNPNLSATTNGKGATIASYSVVSLANLNGTLRFNGSPVTTSTVITDLSKLTYQPTLGYVSPSGNNASFTYTATDNYGTVSNIATYSIPVTAAADVAAAFPATNATSATAGGSLAFAVNFTNNGPNDATSVTRTVQLPAGLGTVTVTGNAGTYNNTTGLVTFTTTPVATLTTTSNLNATITISNVPVGMSSITAVANIATTTDENGATANNTATTTIAVAPSFDLATTINGPTTLVAGTLATYNVTTRNNGPSAIGIPAEGTTAATGAVQTVTLPANLSGVFATNGGTYDKTSGVVTFPDVALASGQLVTNTVSFSVAAASTFAARANVAKTAALTGTDTNSANNLAYLNGSTTAVNTVASAPTGSTTATTANLNVTIAGPAQVTGGTTATYTVTEANNGLLTANSVQTQVSLPLNLSALTLSVNGTAVTGVLSSGVITFNGNSSFTYTQATGVLVLPALNSQAPTASPQTYSIGLTAPATGPLMTVTASVGSTTSDIMPADNVATAQTVVQSLTDVAITLTNLSVNSNGTASTTVLAGQTVSYEVQATNTSSVPARNVQQTVALAPSLDATTLRVNGQAGTLSNGIYTFPGGATYTLGTAALPSTGVLVLPTIPSLMGNAIQTTLVSFAAPGMNIAGTGNYLPASVAISTSSPESNAANNTASQALAVTASQDVTVSIAGPTQAVIGNPVLYTVTTTNNGPAANGTVVTSVTIPTGLDPATLLINNLASISNANGVYTFNSSTTASAATAITYTASTGVVTTSSSNSTSLPKAGLSNSFTIQFTAPDVPLLSATATVTPSGTDINTTNNSAQITTPLSNSNLASVDLVTTVASTGSNSTGGSRTFSVTTTNSTGATVSATNVTQTLVLPAGLVSNGGTVTTTNNGVYNDQTGVITFPIGTVGATAITSTATFALPPNATGSNASSYTLSATASSFTTNPETNVANNTVTGNVTVNAKYDLETTVSGPAKAPSGAAVTYTVSLSNNGPSQATGVTGSFKLPVGVTSYSLNGGATQTVTSGATISLPRTQTNGNMLAGTTELYQISFTAPATTFTVQSDITTSSSVAETSVAPNTATLTTVINQAPVAYDVVNKAQSPEGNTALALALTPLSAGDTDGGSIASYTITSLPLATQGILFYNGVAAALNQSITDATKLAFAPASTFVGTASFTYTATDNGNGTTAYAQTSNVARYTIPVGLDNNSIYTVNAAKGGTNIYKLGDEIARVFDSNSGVATTATIFTANPVNGSVDYATGVVNNGIGAASATAFTTTPYPGTVNTLADLGLSLNLATGRITVTTPANLKSGTYTLPITTTDGLGGVTTQSVTFTIGAFPLPVTLVAFTADAVGNRDAQLTWSTASEANNDHFEVERSFDGTRFTKLGQVAGQGTTSLRTAYAFTDANVAFQAAGPVYYRLQQVDTDGTRTYSPVRTVSFAKATELSLGLYPNPAQTVTKLDLSQLPTATTVQVVVLDATGRTVLSATLGGGLPQPLDVANLATGTYNVVVTGTQPDGTPLRKVLRLTKD